MKHFLLVAATVFVALISNAQITLQDYNCTPPDVVSFTYRFVFDADENFDVGSSGANVTWDFSAVTSSSTSTSEMVETSPGFFESSDGSSTVSYSSYDDLGYGFMGADFGGSTTLEFSDRQDYIQYPMTYQTTFSDDFEAIFDFGSQQQTRTGTIVGEGDGYGTLILPDGTIDNVLRIKHTIAHTDEFMGFTTMTSTELRYTWYSANSLVPIFSFATTTSTPVNGDPQTSTVVSYMDAGTVGFESVKAENVLSDPYPNPASGSFAVMLANNELPKTVELVDIHGRTVNADYTFDGDRMNVNVNQLSQGHYILRVTTETGVHHKSVIVN